MGLPPLPVTRLAFPARHLPPRPNQEVSEEQDDAAHRDVNRLPLVVVASVDVVERNPPPALRDVHLSWPGRFLRLIGINSVSGQAADQMRRRVVTARWRRGTVHPRGTTGSMPTDHRPARAVPGRCLRAPAHGLLPSSFPADAPVHLLMDGRRRTGRAEANRHAANSRASGRTSSIEEKPGVRSSKAESRSRLAQRPLAGRPRASGSCAQNRARNRTVRRALQKSRHGCGDG